MHAPLSINRTTVKLVATGLNMATLHVNARLQKLINQLTLSCPACRMGSYEIAKLLTDQESCRLEELNDKLQTPLHLAAMYARKQV